MNLGQINLNYLWIFESVFKKKSMTLAAKDLRLSQSGVSQHIQTFEEQLGEKLFDRINQRIVPTQFAVQLFSKVSKPLAELKYSLNESFSQKHGLQGVVKIGIPMEFGNNVILPLLAEFQKKHSHVSFEIQVGLSQELNQALIQGSLDFAFVDSFVFDRRIETQEVYQEILDLVMLKSKFLELKRKYVTEEAMLFNVVDAKKNVKFSNRLRFVDYQQNESVLKMWLKHHYRLEPKEILIAAMAENVQSIVALVVNGLGAGVIPHHVTMKLEQSYELVTFKGSGIDYKNTISLALLRDKTHSNLSSELIHFLLSFLHSKLKIV